MAPGLVAGDGVAVARSRSRFGNFEMTARALCTKHLYGHSKIECHVRYDCHIVIILPSMVLVLPWMFDSFVPASKCCETTHRTYPISHPYIKPLQPTLRLPFLLRHQVPQRQIIHHIFHILDPILQPIAAAAQAIVLEVQHLEASEQVLDKLVDEQRALVVAEGDSIASKAGLR
jgi:hypothetical protein